MSTLSFKLGRQYYLKNCKPDGCFNTWYFQFFVLSAFDYVFWAKYKKRMINLILFGPPGSGKGTQAAKLVAKCELLHISTGDLFRYEMGNSTPLGLEAKSYMEKGQLVPDEVTIGMLRNKVEANPFVEGYIFDGFPRTIPQADALDNLLAEEGNEVSVLLMLDVPDEELVKRLLSRGKESGRADDVDEGIIRNRIEVYKNETTPVFDYYAEKGKAVKIQGVGSIEEIFLRLCDQIDGL
jgi:adenylate kinase